MKMRLLSRCALASLCCALLLSSCLGGKKAPSPAQSESAPPQAAPAPDNTPDHTAAAGDYRPLIPDFSAQIAGYQDFNLDTVGWLYIPDTKISEPVFQTNNNGTYLYRDARGSYRSTGSLFMDYECSLGDGDGQSFSRNTIIYGHNLGNPVAVRDDPEAERFGQLMKFTDETFAREHPYLYFTTPQACMVYEIFTVAYVDSYPGPVSYILTDYPDNLFQALLESMRGRSLYDYDVQVGTQDKILTLSCCSHKYGTEKENPHQRFAVMARLMDEGGPFAEEARMTLNADWKEPDYTKYDLSIPLEQRLGTLNWMNLSAEQKLEDLDFLWNTLQKNYPYFGLQKREAEVDARAVYETYRALAAQGGSDAQFYQLLNEMVAALDKLGLLRLVSPSDYDETAAELEKAAANADAGTDIKTLWSLYSQPGTAKAYESLSVPLAWMDTYSTAYADAQWRADGNKESFSNTPSVVPVPSTPPLPVEIPSDTGARPVLLRATENLTAKLYQAEGTAYIRVHSLRAEHMDADGKFLLNFYRQTQSYENLVFDFTDASGADFDYFDRLIAAPFISAPVRAPYYQLAMGGEITRPFLGEAEQWSPISSLPALPGLNREDQGAFGLWRQITREITPAAQTIKRGRIWFLVDGRMALGGQYAAAMAKAGGFAALVGDPVQGIGVSNTTAAFTLPNSGWLVEYMADYAVAADGTLAHQALTQPDVQPMDLETPLEAFQRASAKS